jgi:DNA primase
LLVSEGFDVNVALLPTGLDPDTFIQRHGRDAYLTQLKQSRPYLDFLLDRAASAHDLQREDARREFLRKMLAVAARIPDATARDQFADRLAHKARVTEAVVRTEIRRAAGARKTELPIDRLQAAATPLRDVERGLLWALVHAPGDATGALADLEAADLSGLRSQSLLEKAVAVSAADPARVTSLLMDGLSDTEAQLLATVASAEQPPSLDLQECVRVLRFGRIERQLAEIQRDIDRPGQSGEVVSRLLRQKNELRSQLERARRGPRDAYNK